MLDQLYKLRIISDLEATETAYYWNYGFLRLFISALTTEKGELLKALLFVLHMRVNV